MTENQKLREALQAISDIDDSTNHAVDASAALDRIGKIARQALALPAAEQVDDINVVESFTSAAPMGERELPPLPSCARWEERIKTLMQQCGHPNSMSIYQAFKQFQNEFEHEMIAYARAALSAGDAVDAQRYRWLREQHWSNSAICCVYKPKQNVRLGGTCPSGDLLDSAIDAAMRKGQL